MRKLCDNTTVRGRGLAFGSWSVRCKENSLLTDGQCARRDDTQGGRPPERKQADMQESGMHGWAAERGSQLTCTLVPPPPRTACSIQPCSFCGLLETQAQRTLCRIPPTHLQHMQQEACEGAAAWQLPVLAASRQAKCETASQVQMDMHAGRGAGKVLPLAAMPEQVAGGRW